MIIHTQLRKENSTNRKKIEQRKGVYLRCRKNFSILLVEFRMEKHKIDLPKACFAHIGRAELSPEV